MRNCEYATFFHSPTWIKVLEKTYPHYSNATVGFIFSTGNRAIFPLVAEHSKGIVFEKVKYKSMPPGVYGGVLAEKRLTSEEIGAIFEHLTSTDISDLKVVENPLEHYEFPKSFVAKTLFTQILPLDADFEQLRIRFSRGQKSNIKQAQKKGVTVRIADSLEDYEHYYHIYQGTLKRWGKRAGTSYPWALFLNLFETRDPDVKLWLAEKDRKIIAGVLALYCNSTILYWHGCSLQEYLDHYPNNLLHMEVIKDGCARGYKVYDFNPSGGHEGVVKFKESFSAKRVDFKAYHWKQNRLIPWTRKYSQRLSFAERNHPVKEEKR
ncbi:MAG: hypothetical protein AMJ42_03720 [Deltaproteobacteria bacterium DG_8]|nr:MAG: hypothetical protein AMJ42_03720 [Deltaproteobacteria bacterium DG_8]